MVKFWVYFDGERFDNELNENIKERSKGRLDSPTGQLEFPFIETEKSVGRADWKLEEQ